MQDLGQESSASRPLGDGGLIDVGRDEHRLSETGRIRDNDRTISLHGQRLDRALGQVRLVAELLVRLGDQAEHERVVLIALRELGQRRRVVAATVFTGMTGTTGTFGGRGAATTKTLFSDNRASV